MEGLEFKKDSVFLPYLAGYFDARGSFIVDKQNNVTMNFYGNVEFLEKLNSLFKVGSITLNPSSAWKIMNRDIPKVLDNINQYIIIKKLQAMEIIEALKNKDQNISINEPPEDIDFFDYAEEEWLYLYIVGYFDGLSRWTLKKHPKSNEYYLQISLISPYSDLVILLYELFNVGYILPYNDKFKFMAVSQDSLDLIKKLEPFLLNKKPELEIALKFKKFLDSGEYKEIEKLSGELKSSKKQDSNTTMILNLCEKLFKKITSKSKSFEISKSRFCQEAIHYAYANLDSFKITEDLCGEEKKNFQVAINIDEYLEEKIKVLSSFDEYKSSAIRRALTFYLKDLEIEKEDNDLDEDIDPLDLLEELKKGGPY